MNLQPIDDSDFVQVSSLEELATTSADLAVLVHEDEHEVRATGQPLCRDVNLFGNSNYVAGLDGNVQLRRPALKSYSMKGATFFPSVALLLTQDGRYIDDTFTYIPQWGDIKKAEQAFGRTGDVYRIDDALFAALSKSQMIYGLSISPATIARYNYGHFMFDGLSAGWFQYRNLLQMAPRVVVPWMLPWQRELYTLLGMGNALHELRNPVYLERVITSSQVGGSLQKPSKVVRSIFDELRMKCATDNDVPKKIYIRRAPGAHRPIRNREPFEKILANRGYHFFQPEEHSVADQIKMMGRAKIIVGQGGAAMNNVLFAPIGVQVLEIIPDAYQDNWIRVGCDLMGGLWNGFYCEVRDEDIRVNTDSNWPGSKDITYDIPLDMFAVALDIIELGRL
jgi:hypothetical protein